MDTLVAFENYTYQGASLIVRNGRYGMFDRGIFREVFHSYFWENLRRANYVPKLVVDIGAHIGSFSIWAHHFWPELLSFSVEVERDNFQVLATNLQPLSRASYVWARFDYSKEPKKLIRSIDNSGGHIVCSKDATYDIHAYETVDIPDKVVTLKDIFRLYRQQNIGILKLDCEGSEIDFFLQETEKNFQRIEIILGEYHVANSRFLEVFRASKAAQLFDLKTYPTSQELGTFLAVQKELPEGRKIWEL